MGSTLKLNCKNTVISVFCFFSAVLGQTNFPHTKINYVVSGDTLRQPYYRNVSLDSTSEHIKYAVISLHGDGRNSFEHYNVIYQLTELAGLQDSTILIAPTYPIQEDINTHNLSEDILYWPDIDWNAGNLSRSTQSNPRPFRISSFSTMDTIYQRLVENNSGLEKIVLTGHSAGSQMVVRYAAGGRGQLDIEDENIELVYVPVNTPSFLYYDEHRVINQNETVFDFGPTNCASANQYKYGLDNLNQYMEETGVATIKNNFEQASLTYLIGEYDFGGQTSTCARMVQGNNRLIRTHIYFAYIGYFYGDSIYNSHRMAEIPNASHDFSMTVLTDCGLKSIFDIGLCDLFVDGSSLFNHKPIAYAGEDKIVNPGSIIVLDGSESYDVDGQVVSFHWEQLSGDNVFIVSSDSAIAQFIMPNHGFVDIKLTIIDNEGKSATDTVSYVVNQPPTAHAGGDIEAGYSAVVLLDGSGSTDEHSEITSYLWEQLGGETVSVFSSDQQVATIYTPEITTLLSFSLAVFDEQGLSDKDTVVVYVSSLSVSNSELKNHVGISMFPNPFNSLLSINFSSSGDFITNSISIYSITGKKIQHWSIDNKSQKNSHILWDGKDQHGFEIRSGLYFVRFEGNNKSIIKKVSYLK